jgi:hypothetical protein
MFGPTSATHFGAVGVCRSCLNAGLGVGFQFAVRRSSGSCGAASTPRTATGRAAQDKN